MRRERNVDWNRLHAEEHPAAVAVDSRWRLRVCLIAFVVLAVVVFARAVQLEVTGGAAFRGEAARPLVRQKSLPGVRGRILARDGTVLARDKKVLALGVHYRYLEDPPNPGWLRSMARSRLSRRERKDSGRVASEEAAVRMQCRDLGHRLAQRCGLSDVEWSRRAARVQARVERIAQSVDRRRQESFQQRRAEKPKRSILDEWLGPVEELPPGRSTVREELDYHVLVENVPLSLVAEIEGHPELYPGVTILDHSRRDYPSGPVAGHVLGHLGPVTKRELKSEPEGDYENGDRRGRTGLELQYEALLHGCRGEAVETTDRSGRVLSFDRRREPGLGRDLVLTLEARLQRTAESLLDRALARRELAQAVPKVAGGAIVVMDVHTGAILAAASAPRFDPNWFAGDSASEVESALADPAKPMFDRVCRMAIPPGSVFKTLTAVALLEAAQLDPNESFHCRGYLHKPDRFRCQIYRRRGVGHGDVTLAGALAQSCNVYFFHYAGEAGPEALVDWATRFGFAAPTGIDLPGEAAGRVPTPETIAQQRDRPWRVADTRLVAVGQGSLTATPLQIARMMAAVANGGKLVTPHLVRHLGMTQTAEEEPVVDVSKASGQSIDVPPPRPIPGLRRSTLDAIRQGLRATVESPQGTAHGTVFLDLIEVAGKTGTAETGGGRSDHAWFAGYVPIEKPKFALVVVLQHSGNGGEVAGPVARRLVLRLRELGLL